MASVLQVELTELLQVEQQLESLLNGKFGANATSVYTNTAPLGQTQVSNGTAASMSQTQLPGGLRNAAGNEFFNYGQFNAASTITEAHGQVQTAVKQLLQQVQQQIASVQARMKATQQKYHDTESNLTNTTNTVGQ